MTISDKEAEQLLGLLNELISSKQFIENAIFIDGIFAPRLLDENRIKQIFSKYTKRRGRLLVHTNSNWESYKARLGWKSNSSSTKVMPFAHFLIMEKHLYENLNLNPKVIELLMTLNKQSEFELNHFRDGELFFSENKIKNFFQDFIKSIKETKPLSKRKYAAAISLIADSGIMFTTRDWGVAASISQFIALSMEIILPDETN